MTQERAEITVRGLPRTENRSGQPQARGAAPEMRPIPEASETCPGHGEPSTGFVSAAHSPASKRPFDLQRSAATGEGWGGTLPPRGPPAHARASSGTRVRRLSLARAMPATTVHQHRGWPALRPALTARPRCGRPAGMPRGRALTQESCGSTLRSRARREKAHSGTTAGAAQPLTSRSGTRSAEPPRGGCGVAGIRGTGRAQRRRCLPCEPFGGR